MPLLDGFDLVIPSLPGYGFSERPERLTTRDTAKLWHALMRGLGYERYGACGDRLGRGGDDLHGARRARRRCSASTSPTSTPRRPREPGDRRPSARTSAAARRWDAVERGYSFQQGTRPQTLAYGLTDSPVAPGGLDPREVARVGGHRRRPGGRFDRDVLLSW